MMTPEHLSAIKARLEAADELLDVLAMWVADEHDHDRLQSLYADLSAVVAEVERLQSQITAVVADCDAARADALRLHGEAVAAITDRDAALARAEAAERRSAQWERRQRR